MNHMPPDRPRATGKVEADPRDVELRALRARLADVLLQRDRLLNSTIWRASRPIRVLADAMPRGMRRLLRHLLPSSAPVERLNFVLPILPAAMHTVRDEDYAAWIEQCDTLSDSDRTAIRDHIARLAHRPLISVVMPAYETPEELLRAAIASVRNQLYTNWELCIADDASSCDVVARVAGEAAASDDRIKFVRRATRGNIAEATNSALALATGEFVALMDHDDLLAEQALYEVAVEIEAHPDADLLYSDEDQIDLSGRRQRPYFKPDWNIDLMLGHNAVNHLGVYRHALVQRLGGLRTGFEGSQDYDLALRVIAASEPARIRHIPAILYHWRQLENSFSHAAVEACRNSARRAIGDYLATTGAPAGTEIVAGPATTPTWTRVRWPLPEPAPRVSLIVPTRDRGELLQCCADGILNRTDYANFELIIVDNESSERQTLDLLGRLSRDERVRVLSIKGPFNYSALNNTAAAVATGEVLVLVNNDVEVIEPGWLTEMVSHAIRPDIGAVGARLLYPAGTIQHVGVVLGVTNFENGPGVAGHLLVGADAEDPGYFGQAALTRELAAVTGACLALRKSVFQEVGGLEAQHLTTAFNDIDLCLRLRERGLRNVVTPYAELYHRESASRGYDLSPAQIDRYRLEHSYMRERWGPALDTDPFYNENLSREDPTFRLAIPARRTRPWLRR